RPRLGSLIPFLSIKKTARLTPRPAVVQVLISILNFRLFLSGSCTARNPPRSAAPPSHPPLSPVPRPPSPWPPPPTLRFRPRAGSRPTGTHIAHRSIRSTSPRSSCCFLLPVCGAATPVPPHDRRRTASSSKIHSCSDAPAVRPFSQNFPNSP